MRSPQAAEIKRRSMFRLWFLRMAEEGRKLTNLLKERKLVLTQRTHRARGTRNWILVSCYHEPDMFYVNTYLKLVEDALFV